jgi:hypothetical protein
MQKSAIPKPFTSQAEAMAGKPHGSARGPPPTAAPAGTLQNPPAHPRGEAEEPPTTGNFFVRFSQIGARATLKVVPQYELLAAITALLLVLTGVNIEPEFLSKGRFGPREIYFDYDDMCKFIEAYKRTRIASRSTSHPWATYAWL